MFQTAHFLKRRKAALLQKTAPKNPWFLHDFAAEGLIESILPIKRDFENALELFSLNGQFAQMARANNLLGGGCKIGELKGYEPAFEEENPQAFNCINELASLPLGVSQYDLILSSNGLNWVNDLPGILHRIRKSLKPGGAFFASFIGGKSLFELRQAFLEAESEIAGGAALRVSPMIELEAAVKLLSRAGFETPVSSVETLCVRYNNMFDLVRDIKLMGENASFSGGANKPLTRQIIARAADIYQGQFQDNDGRVRATFEIISVNGWA